MIAWTPGSFDVHLDYNLSVILMKALVMSTKTDQLFNLQVEMLRSKNGDN